MTELGSPQGSSSSLQILQELLAYPVLGGKGEILDVFIRAGGKFGVGFPLF